MIVKLLVEGGSMKPGPALSQKLGPMGINLGKVISDVNTATAGFKGLKVPVELDVDPASKAFKIKVFSPPVAELIKKELTIEKGSGKAGAVYVGNLAFEQVVGIAKTKEPNMLASNFRAAVTTVLGSCTSLGVMVDNKNAKEIQAAVEKGVYDAQIKEKISEVPVEKKKELDAFFKKIKEKQEEQAKQEELAKLAAEEEAAKAAAAGAAAPGAAAKPGAPAAAAVAAKEAVPAKEAAAKPSKEAAKPAKK